MAAPASCDCQLTQIEAFYRRFYRLRFQHSCLRIEASEQTSGEQQSNSACASDASERLNDFAPVGLASAHVFAPRLKSVHTHPDSGHHQTLESPRRTSTLQFHLRLPACAEAPACSESDARRRANWASDDRQPDRSVVRLLSSTGRSGSTRSAAIRQLNPAEETVVVPPSSPSSSPRRPPPSDERVGYGRSASPAVEGRKGDDKPSLQRTARSRSPLRSRGRCRGSSLSSFASPPQVHFHPRRHRHTLRGRQG
jgi:hypothetical protein